MLPDFDTMNETDVREIIVRPLLHRLGFAHGTQANIRTEVTLRYDKAFLGRKNPTRDPPLVGRADYICEAISYGRWAVEVKAPAQALTSDDVEQAHTYCAHPQIAAQHFLLTNGREFRLYATAQLDAPLHSWRHEETEQHMMALFNILGPEAIRRRAALLRPDMNKPLGPHLTSKLRIIGGEVLYGPHTSNHPLFQVDALNGMIGAVTGVSVTRAEDGRLFSVVSVRSPYQQLAELNKLAGLEDFQFYCADEFVSNNPDRPSIFQNVVRGGLPPGIEVQVSPFSPKVKLPIGFNFACFTEAVGFIDGDAFKGVLAFEYEYELIVGGPSGNPQIDHYLRMMPRVATMTGTGQFSILVAAG
jgi:hypothetical protein